MGGSPLGRRVLLSRLDLGLNQKELAEAAAVSNSLISDIERGKVTNVGIDNLLAIADALGVSLLYLMGRTDNPLLGLKDEEDQQDGSSPGAVQLNPLEAELLATFRTLTAEDQDRLLAIASLFHGAAGKRHYRQIERYIRQVESDFGPAGAEEFMRSIEAALAGDWSGAATRVAALRNSQHTK